ncbi:hypothetical protein [Thermosulfuriphilus sp.]
MGRLKVSQKEVTTRIETLKKTLSLIEGKKKELIETLEEYRRNLKEGKEKMRQIENETAEMILANRKLAVPEKTAFFLLQSNIIQQSIIFSTNLNRYLNDLNKEVMDLREEITSLDQKAMDIKARIETWKGRLALLSPVEIIQPPFASPGPVKPKKGLIIAVVLVSSFFMAIFLAFFLEFWEKNRDKISQDK